MFDDKERAFLRSIQENPIWMSILKKMSEFSATPRYQSSLSEEKQLNNWIYQSGRLDEREMMVDLLSLKLRRSK